MLKSAAEVKKIIDEKREYILNCVEVEDSINWMIRECETWTYSVIRSPKLLEELKALGYSIEKVEDSINPNMYKISIC